MPASQDFQRSFFNDRQSGASTPNGMSSPRRGADIYSELMESIHRRIRKPQPHYGNDAAGLTNAHRFQARSIPSKGKGTPPPDNFEPIFRTSKKFIPGRSFMAASELLHHHNDSGYIPTSAVNSPRPMTANPLGQSMDSGILSLAKQQSLARPMSATGERPCLKIFEQSFKGSLQGSGLMCITEDPIKRPLRKPGTMAPTADTKARVLVLAEDYTIPTTPSRPSPAPLQLVESVNSPRDAMLNNTWQRQAYEAGMLSARPSTAPPQATGLDRSASVPHARMNEARRRYQEVQVANLDVFTYRHSGGICSKEYKLDDSRSPAPQLSSPNADAAREAYFAARQNYAKNRVTSLTSMKKYC